MASCSKVNDADLENNYEESQEICITLEELSLIPDAKLDKFFSQVQMNGPFSTKEYFESVYERLSLTNCYIPIKTRRFLKSLITLYSPELSEDIPLDSQPDISVIIRRHCLEFLCLIRDRYLELSEELDESGLFKRNKEISQDFREFLTANNLKAPVLKKMM